jgi:uncharacterized lipoprotein YajG
MNSQNTILTFIIFMSFIGLSGCTTNVDVAFQYECRSEKLSLPDFQQSSISFQINDHRTIKNTKQLGKYSSFRFISSEAMSSVLQKAFEAEAARRGYTVTPASSHIIQIDLQEVCAIYLFAMSSSATDMYGLIKADVTILNNNSAIHQKSFMTAVTGANSQIVKDTYKLTANAVLHEFVQDVMSDPMLIDTLKDKTTVPGAV